MPSLALENENRQLKEIIVQLRLTLESNHLDMLRKMEKDRNDFNQLIIQLQTSILELRSQLESIHMQHLKDMEEFKKNKNAEINQLQSTIKAIRGELEKAIKPSDD